MTQNETDGATAVMFLLLTASEMLMKDVEAGLLAQRRCMRQEPKRIINGLLRAMKGARFYYDQLTEQAVEKGQAEGDDPILDAYLQDANNLLRYVLHLENATRGPKGEENGIKIESMLKAMSREPMFTTEYIDKHQMK